MGNSIEKKLQHIKIKQLTQIERDEMWKSIHIRMQEEIPVQEVVSLRFFEMTRKHRNRIAFAAVGFLALFAGSSTALAKVADVSRPGDFLYPVDLAFEKINLSFSTEERKDHLKIAFAEERLKEIEDIFAEVAMEEGVDEGGSLAMNESTDAVAGKEEGAPMMMAMMAEENTSGDTGAEDVSSDVSTSAATSEIATMSLAPSQKMIAKEDNKNSDEIVGDHARQALPPVEGVGGGAGVAEQEKAAKETQTTKKSTLSSKRKKAEAAMEEALKRIEQTREEFSKKKNVEALAAIDTVIERFAETSKRNGIQIRDIKTKPEYYLGKYNEEKESESSGKNTSLDEKASNEERTQNSMETGIKEESKAEEKASTTADVEVKEESKESVATTTEDGASDQKEEDSQKDAHEGAFFDGIDAEVKDKLTEVRVRIKGNKEEFVIPEIETNSIIEAISKRYNVAPDLVGSALRIEGD